MPSTVLADALCFPAVRLRVRCSSSVFLVVWTDLVTTISHEQLERYNVQGIFTSSY